MAYNFSAEKCGADPHVLHQSMRRFALFEFFPVEVSEERFTLGISIPFKSMDDPQFELDLAEMMTYLIAGKGFKVTDLFTGKPVLASHIAGLARQISA